MSNNNSSSGGIGFLGLLAIVFIVLKLTNHIDWSWWWVTCPLWGPAAIVIFYFIIRLILVLISGLLSNKATKERTKAQMKIIQADIDQENERIVSGKSKWQQRMEEVQKAQKLRENK